MKEYLLSGWESIQSGLITALPSLGITIIVAVLVAWGGVYMLRRVIERAVNQSSDLREKERQQRIDTLQSIASGTTRLLVGVVAVMVALSQMGISIGPLLATAGVAGAALGFGAQYLIQDIIAGLFVLIENQYSIDDVVCLDGTCGKVEQITLRMTQLRDLEGVVHHIPNGKVDVVSNRTKHYSKVHLDMGVDYAADIDAVIDVINSVGKELAEDSQWADKLIDPPEFLRVDEFADSTVVLKVTGRVRPGSQWGVTGEFRKRLKKAFDEADISIPFPQVTVHRAGQPSE